MTWETMTKAEQKEVSRLCSRHRDIRVNGAAALGQMNERAAAKTERQLRLKAFVQDHGITCFKCNLATGDWAKTGVTNGRPWAICLSCVKRGAA